MLKAIGFGILGAVILSVVFLVIGIFFGGNSRSSETVLKYYPIKKDYYE